MTENEERTLLLTYRPWLRGAAHRSLRGRPGVEDLAQEMWISMWKALRADTGIDGAPLDWWLKQVALRRMTQCLRDWHDPMKQRQHTFTEDVAAVIDLPAELVEIELAYHHGEIYAAMDALSPREREYVIARFWAGMGPTQLKAHFGYSPDGLWRTARPKLAGALAHLGVAA